MAINDMILPGVKNPLLAVAEEIRKQISAKALEQPKTSPPVAGMPEDRDYAEGMQRPDLTKLKAEREFKATPSRTSAFLVALGNILQDKQNLEAAKQQTEQNEYNAKLADAMEMNKLFKTGKMKREFDESDPDTQLRREMLQLDLAQKKEMYPLEKQYKQTALDRLLAKGTGGGRASGGSATPTFSPGGLTQIPSKEDLDLKIANSKNKKEQDFWKGKRDAFYGKDSKFKTVFGAGTDPNDGFEYQYLLDDKGKVVGTTNIIRKKNIDPFATTIQDAMPTPIPSGPSQVAPTQSAPVVKKQYTVGSEITLKNGKRLRVINEAGDTEEIK